MQPLANRQQNPFISKEFKKMINQYLELKQEQREIQANSDRDGQFENPQQILKTPIISHQFKQAPILLRFVTVETVAFLFNIEVEQIHRIECWQHVVYVHAEGISRFVSYADFPPVIGKQKPDEKEFKRWRKRWYDKSKRKIAPESWVKFYTKKFTQAKSIYKLREWGELIAVFKSLFESIDLERLREDYRYQKFLKLKFACN